MKKIAVIGLGRFGTTLATSLAQQGAEVMAIDLNEEIVESMKDEVAYPVALDATDVNALEAQNITEFDTCVVAIGNNFEGMLLATVNLMKLEVKNIVARCMTPTQRTILERLGVERIILPEVEVASNLAGNLLRPELKSIMKLADDYEVAEITVTEKISNKSLLDLELRKKFNLNVIAIERVIAEQVEGEQEAQRKVLGITDPKTVLIKDDTLVIVGKQKDLKKFIDLHIE